MKDGISRREACIFVLKGSLRAVFLNHVPWIIGHTKCSKGSARASEEISTLNTLVKIHNMNA